MKDEWFLEDERCMNYLLQGRATSLDLLFSSFSTLVLMQSPGPSFSFPSAGLLA